MAKEPDLGLAALATYLPRLPSLSYPLGVTTFASWEGSGPSRKESEKLFILV